MFSSKASVDASDNHNADSLNHSDSLNVCGCEEG